MSYSGCMKPGPLAVTVTQGEHRIIVRAGGELDLATAPALENALKGFGSDGLPCVLDLEDVTFIDSSGLRLLIVATERARAEGRSLTVLPSAAVTKLVRLTGLEEALLPNA